MPRNCAGNFPKSLRCIGKSDFDRTFLAELQAYESDVDLTPYCEEGFPDPESIEFELVSTTNEDDFCTVRVSCKFSEAVQTGCSDLAFGYPVVAKFDVILDRQDDMVTFEYIFDTDVYQD